jgi:preprotein translocase subunit SecG
MWNIILPVLLFLTSVFLILLVLIQRGRGGGLAGAFGGMGGQSAFGTKAGDLFTRITIGVATFWIVLCAFSVKMLNDTGTTLLSPTMGGAARTATELPGAPAGTPGATAPATDAKATGTAPAAATETPAAAPATTEAPAAEAPAAESTPPASAAPEKSE